MKTPTLATVAILFLSLSGCSTTQSELGNAYYKNTLKNIFTTVGYPPTKVEVKAAATPPTAREMAELLVNEAIIYGWESPGEIQFVKAKDLDGFASESIDVVEELVSMDGFFAEGDKIVEISIEPEGFSPLKMFGLSTQDGYPKADAILSRYAPHTNVFDETTKGSWKSVTEGTWSCSIFLRAQLAGTPVLSMFAGVLPPCLNTGLEHRLDVVPSDPCHANSATAKEFFDFLPIPNSGFNLDGACLGATTSDWSRSHPACANHQENPGKEDCSYATTRCTVLTGLGAGNNVELVVDGDVTTKVALPGGRGTVNLRGKIDLAEGWLTTTHNVWYESNLCACSGNPYRRKSKSNNMVQWEEPRYGVTKTTNVDPDEPLPNNCVQGEALWLTAPVEEELSEEVADPQPTNPKPFDENQQ